MAKSTSFGHLVSLKMEDGNLSDTIRLFQLDANPVYDSDEVYANLVTCHPSADTGRRQYKDSYKLTALRVWEREVLNNFAAGSAGGPDGLRASTSRILLTASLMVMFCWLL